MSDEALPVYLDQMRQAAEDVLAFVDGLTKADFLADKRTRRAVVMSLMIIGEAATRVMDRHAAFAAAHPDIPWRNMRGMRNRIAHGYFEINVDVVWSTVETALPDLLAALTALDGVRSPHGLSRSPGQD